MKKLVAFHGSDHKSGATMLSQSVAELVARNRKEIKVLWTVFGLGDGKDYKDTVAQSLEEFRLQIYSRILNKEEVMEASKQSENLFMLGGIKNISEKRTYFPENAQYFLECMKDDFDLIIADCGNDLDSGISLGALENADAIYITISQKESALRQYEIKSELYQRLNLKAAGMILNHFQKEDPITLHYTARRLNHPYETIFKVKDSEFGRQAERDRKSLLFYGDNTYDKDISEIADSILKQCGLGKLNPEEEKRKKRWINFI